MKPTRSKAKLIGREDLYVNCVSIRHRPIYCGNPWTLLSTVVFVGEQSFKVMFQAGYIG